MRIFNFLLEFIFPSRCFSCKKDAAFLCGSCLSLLPAGNGENIKGIEITARFQYRHPVVRRALWLLKYRGKKALADILSETLWEDVAEIMHEHFIFERKQKILVLPVPLSKRRQHKRGFNQSELLAKGLLSCADEKTIEVRSDILRRVRDTKSQMEIKNRAKRLDNVSGCFCVERPEYVRGKDIIIVDDIVTTGATMREAQKVLEQSGARSVYGVAVAH